MLERLQGMDDITATLTAKTERQLTFAPLTVAGVKPQAKVINNNVYINYVKSPANGKGKERTENTEDNDTRLVVLVRLTRNISD